MAARSSQDLACCCTRYCEGAFEVRFRFRPIILRTHQPDFAGNAINLGLEPPFLGFLDRNDRFADAAPSVVELAKVRIGFPEMTLITEPQPNVERYDALRQAREARHAS